MSAEITFVDYTDLEKKAGQKAARTLRRDIKSVLGVLNISAGSALLKNTTVRSVMKFDSLDHISIATPHYIFKQHYGFEGIKSNGAAMSMKPYNHFTNLFNKTSALDKLADEISEIRAEEVINKIRF
jgi:hypothetical protein